MWAMRSAAALLTSIWMLAASATAQVSPADLKVLNDGLDGKTLVLRGFPQGEKITYDRDGKPSGAPAGVFTLDGYIRVDDVQSASAGVVEIHGHRLVLQYDQYSKTFVMRPVKSRKVSKATDMPPGVLLQVPAETGDQLSKAIDRVFLGPTEKLSSQVPSYWKAFLDQKRPDQKPARGGTPVLLDDNDSAFAGSATAYHVGHGVSAPKPDKTFPKPSPSLKDTKRLIPYLGDQTRLRGVTVLQILVSTTGNLRVLEILRPLGLGLDDFAVEMAETSRLQPAKMHGVAVPAIISLEVNFLDN